MPRHAFTHVLVAAALALASLAGVAATAHAEQVVLLPVTGSDDEELTEHLDDALAEAVLGLSHQPMTEAYIVDAPPPETGNEMRAVAEMQNSTWVVVPRVSGVTPERYRLFLRVGYAPEGRVEELEVTVIRRQEGARLADVLGAMLRPAGVGDDAVRLTEEPTDTGPTPEELEAERQRQEEERAREEAARQEFLARERERAAEEARNRELRWENREQYGQRGHPWLISAGVDIRPIIATGEGGSGGLLWGFSARLGRTFQGLDGFEARAVLDIVTGSAQGFGLGVGAAYLHSFWEDAPVFIGASVELGWYQGLTGNASAAFFVRGAPTVAWRPTDEIYLEVAVGEFQFLSTAGGAATTGVSARFGYRL